MSFNDTSRTLHAAARGGPFSIWVCATRAPLEEVVSPGWFDAAANLFEPFDRIEVTAGLPDNPTHARVLVQEVTGRAVKVAVLESYRVDAPVDYRKGRLKVSMNGNDLEEPRQPAAYALVGGLVESSIGNAALAGAFMEAAETEDRALMNNAWQSFKALPETERAAVAAAYRDTLRAA